MRISVCISDSNDERLARTLASLSHQRTQPEEVLVERRGTVAGSRNFMYRESTGDAIAFIDTDQEAPPLWLSLLSGPIASRKADFVCGPTRPHPAPSHPSRYLAYMDEIERRHYVICESDQTSFPMGNTIWDRRVLNQIAIRRDGSPFDERFASGGEDYDVNIRATLLGFRGQFVKDAWVWHDQSNLDNPLKIMQRKLRYSKGGAMANILNGTISRRLRRPAHLPPYIHWLEGFQKLAQTVGFVSALAEIRHTER